MKRDGASALLVAVRPATKGVASSCRPRKTATESDSHSSIKLELV
jgi:hypothetical protein